MALYAIGDVHGRLDALQALLRLIRFRPNTDRLWLTGDLVNRGPSSAKVVRFVMDLGDAARVVLGNHDFHLLAVANGAIQPQPQDTFHDLLEAPDAAGLLDWLRRRPLALADEESGTLLVHAGVHRDWSAAQTLALAAEVAHALRGARFAAFMRHLYGNEPAQWSESLDGWARLRCITNILTRVRYCRADGSPALAAKAAPGRGAEPRAASRRELVPWYAFAARKTRGRRIVFGHWAALGLYQADDVLGLDSGCVWGRALSAARLDVEPPVIHQVGCAPGDGL